MTREEIAEYNEEAVMYEGLDAAIIGMAERNGLMVVAYDREKAIQICAKHMEVSKDDLEPGETIKGKKHELGIEHFEFNILGCWLGEHTPVFIFKYGT